MLRHSRGTHTARGIFIRIPALEKARRQRVEGVAARGTAHSMTAPPSPDAATTEKMSHRNTAAEPSAPAINDEAAHKSTESLPESPVTGECSAGDGWGTSSALLSVFALAPTITGHGVPLCSPLLSPSPFSLFRSSTTHFLQVPATSTTTTATTRRGSCGLSLCRVECARTRGEHRCTPSRKPCVPSSSLLRETVAQPCLIGRRVSPLSSHVGPQWAEWMTGAGTDDERVPTWSRDSAKTTVTATAGVVEDIEGASKSSNLHEKSHHTLKAPRQQVWPEVWTSNSVYPDVQVCADAAADTLRAFACQKLGQHTPQLQLLAEKAYTAGDEDVESRAMLLRKSADTAELARDGAPRTSTPAATAAAERTVATRRVPVETYVERTLLSRTSGTATLQLALQKALAGAAATWWHADGQRETKRSLSGDGSNTMTETEGAAPHLLWSGRDWVVETDVQLTAMQERLLRTLEGRAHESLRLRAWLRSQYPAGSPTTPSPAVSASEPELFAATGWDATVAKKALTLAAGAAVAAARAGEGPLFGDSASLSRTAHAQPSLPPLTLTPPCASWQFRLHKSWLVTGVHAFARLCTHLGDSDSESEGSRNNNSSSSSSGRYYSRRSPRPPLVNYDLLTGMPLPLRWRRSTSSGDWISVPASAPLTRQDGEPIWRRTNARDTQHMHTGNRHTTAICSTAGSTANGGDGATAAKVAGGLSRALCKQSPFAPSLMQPSPSLAVKVTPFSLAARSQRVGWVPVQRVLSPHLVTRRTAWSLPPTLRAFTLPSCATEVREPLLAEPPAPHSAAPLWGGVSVQRLTWCVGFFAHEAPAWWATAVLAALRGRQGKAAALPRDVAQPQQSQHGKLQSNASLLHRLIDCRCIPPLPREVLSARRDASVLCVLQLRAAVPTVRRAPVWGDGERADDSEDVESRLFWSLHEDHADTAAVVNFAFTLSDVQKEDAGTSDSPCPVLYYVELKAGLEVLHRVTHTATTAAADCRGLGTYQPTSWWPLLEAFYQANRVELTQTPSCPVNRGSCAAPLTNGAAELHRSRHDDENGFEVVSALCHPSALEVAQKLLRCITAAAAAAGAGDERAAPSPGRTPAALQVAEEQEGEEEVCDGSAALTMRWPLDEHYRRLHRTLCTTTTTDTSADMAEADEGDARAEEKEAEGSGVDSPLSMLPYGVVVQAYDDDGTRIPNSEHEQLQRPLHPGSDEEGEEEDEALPDDATAFGTSFHTVTPRDWPALDRRSFDKGSHRMEDALLPPCSSQRGKHAFTAGGGSAIVHRGGDVEGVHLISIEDDKKPRLCLPLCPPIAVGALGVARALSIVAAQAEAKLYGYPSAQLRPPSPPTPPQPKQQASLYNPFVGFTFGAVGAAAGEEAEPLSSPRTIKQQPLISARDSEEEEDRCRPLVPTHIFTSSEPNTYPISPLLPSSPTDDHEKREEGGEEGERPRPDTSIITHSVNLFEEIMVNEHQRFAGLWRPWLPYLPLDVTSDSAFNPFTPTIAKVENGGAVQSAGIPQDPHRTFPFLRSSRVRDRHLHNTAPLTRRPDYTVDSNTLTDGKITETLQQIFTQDIGISLLQLHSDSTYINAFNLLHKQDPPTQDEH